MLKKIVLALGLSLISSSAWAVCGAIPLTIKDASNATQNISSASAADGNCKTYVDADNASQIHTDLIAPIAAGTNTIGNVIPIPGSAGACTPYHLSGGTGASNNSNSMKGSAGVLCDLIPINTTTTLYYLKLYDSATAPTCSSATNLKHVIPIPFGSSNSGSGFVRSLTFGEVYSNGIGYCVTGGGGDTDNTNAATGVYIEASYK